MKTTTFRLVTCLPHKSSGAERQKTFQVYESQNSLRTCTDRPRDRFAADHEHANLKTWRHIAKHCKRHSKRRWSILKLYWQQVNRNNCDACQDRPMLCWTGGTSHGCRCPSNDCWQWDRVISDPQAFTENEKTGGTLAKRAQGPGWCANPFT